MAKSEKQAPAEETAAKPKGKKLLLILIVLLVLGIAAGAGWYFTQGHSGDDSKEKEQIVLLDQPKFIALAPFTVNLQREEGDQFLQVGISLKIYDPKLEDEIKANLPEIRSKLLLLLSSKRASQLRPVEGKKKLADEIITEVDGVLGIKRPAPKAAPVKLAMNAASAVDAASSAAANGDILANEDLLAEDIPVEEDAPVDEDAAKAGIVDVLFTSFIIQ